MKQIDDAKKAMIPLCELLYKYGEDDIVKMSFRIKKEKSVFEKAKKLNGFEDDVFDILGFSLVFNNIIDCYKYLEKIKELSYFDDVVIKDYISNPCGPNKYQAIHFRCKYLDANTEIQLKTVSMDLDANSVNFKYKDIYAFKR